MRRLIIGAIALVTGLLAAGGVALTTRRRRNRDEILPLDATPPLGTGGSADSHASVEADFGPVGAPAEPETPAPAKRKRVRRKPAKATLEEATPAETDAQTTDEAAVVTTADPAPADPAPAATAEAAEIAAAAEAAELSGGGDLPSAS